MSSHDHLIIELNEKFPNLPLKERLQLLTETFSAGCFSTSLSKEDQVITDVIYQDKANIDIFAIDTGRLFEESLRVLQMNLERYGQQPRLVHPESADLEELHQQDGAFGFYESYEKRRRCCHIRKVKPLTKALQGKDLWITGLRREQNVSRTELPFAAWDENFQLIKVNPIADWSEADVEKHISENNVPVCSLHGKNFPSIGCAPCTRAVQPGADPRSGRWWWENPDGKECGLHK